MPRKATEFEPESANHTANFHQIVVLAEKLVESLAKSVQQAEDDLK
jgi:hypothetical protein